jgi:hypothetical protein
VLLRGSLDMYGSSFSFFWPRHIQARRVVDESDGVRPSVESGTSFELNIIQVGVVIFVTSYAVSLTIAS